MALEFNSLSSAPMYGSGTETPFAEDIVVAPVPPLAFGTQVTSGRYGEGRKSRAPAIALAIGIHLALAPALLSLGYQAVKTREASLTAVNLSPPPPPAAATPPEPPQAEPLQTTVQPLPVTIPTPLPRPVVAAIPNALPQVQPAAVAASPVPVAAPAPAPATPPSTVTSDALATRMISGGPPSYPVESRRKKEQGTVKLMLILGIDGRVETIAVTGSSGFDRLDDAALKAVRRWRWAPTMRDGTPVKVRGFVEIPFVLTHG